MYGTSLGAKALKNISFIRKLARRRRWHRRRHYFLGWQFCFQTPDGGPLRSWSINTKNTKNTKEGPWDLTRLCPKGGRFFWLVFRLKMNFRVGASCRFSRSVWCRLMTMAMAAMIVMHARNLVYFFHFTVLPENGATQNHNGCSNTNWTLPKLKSFCNLAIQQYSAIWPLSSAIWQSGKWNVDSDDIVLKITLIAMMLRWS